MCLGCNSSRGEVIFTGDRSVTRRVGEMTSSTNAPASAHSSEGHGRLIVKVYDEDAGGPPITIEAGPGEKVSKVIAEFYERIGATPKPGDRVLCMATGQPVNQDPNLHLKDLAAGPCSDLVFTYAKDTGGACA
ncbi:hypothetical protein NBCG_01612 [Nocardioidaceae bacterium Broad-1]|nr:hypothetical protein NBCG_01612 [Nocardioidaceae bacterium Broad-1]